MSAAACFRSLFLLLFASIALGTTNAYACSATSQDVFVVGNTATDAACNYNTIQAAINAATCPAGTRIYLTSEVSYTGQHLAITNKNISLIGRKSGTSCGALSAVCGGIFPCPTTPLETIDGSHTNGASVITVRGTSNLTIQYLTITGGQGTNAGTGTPRYGGGIDYAAIGTLIIDTSTIFDNKADNGGGIRFQGNGGAADLHLNAHTFITNNTATATGGGIRLEDNASAYIDADPTWIAQNVANDYGGGIAVVGNAYVHIGSPGYKIASYLGVVYGNTAKKDGGGIALIPQKGNDDAKADIFAADPNHPVRIENNRAWGTGGGIYLGAYADNTFGSPSAANLGGAQIDDNAAQEGSGIYANTYSSLLYTTAGFVSFKAGHCAAGIECNTVSNNRAVNSSDTPTAGSAILVQTGGYLGGQQLSMRGNQGAHAIRVVDSLYAPVDLDSCLLAGNTVTGELVTFGNASASINQCTFAGNTIGGPSVIYAETGFTMTNSIVAQGTQATLHYVGSAGGRALSYVMAQETASLNLGGTNIMNADPLFVDAANGDYHLNAYSPAIDVAPPVSGDDRDLENLPRDHDLANVPDLNGDRDLGAYERQFECAADTIFCNGFEP